MNEEEINNFLEQFERDHFHAQSLPDDIKKLITYRLSKGLDRVFQSVDVKIWDLGETHPLISGSYLNAKARANLYTMANVQAMNEISANMGVFAYGEFGPEGAIGFWPMDAKDPALFSLDTEGQYELCLGETFSETLYFETIVGDYEKGRAECEKLFRELDIPFQSGITKDEIWAQVAARKAQLTDHPQTRRDLRCTEIESEPDKIIGYTPLPDPIPEKTDPPKFWKFWKRK